MRETSIPNQPYNKIAVNGDVKVYITETAGENKHAFYENGA